MNYRREKKIAIESVQQAASLCIQIQSDMVDLNILEKGDNTPVTIADFGVQALICQHLQTAFPNDPIVAEEDASDLKATEHADQLTSVTTYVRKFYPKANVEDVCRWIDAGNSTVGDRFWTLDPIDGTKGFLRNDQYAIALALIEDGQVQVAVMACPALPIGFDVNTEQETQSGSIFVAVHGAGAAMASLSGEQFESFELIQVSGTGTTDLRFVESVECGPGHGNHELQEEIARAVGITQPSLRIDSQAKYGVVARGEAAFYLRLPSSNNPDHAECIWDHAAGSLIVEEAGGRVTDIAGKPLDFASDCAMNDNRGLIVSAGPFHDDIIASVAGLI